MPGTSPRLSGSRRDTALESLQAHAPFGLSSWPDLFRPSTCSSAAKEHVDARDKQGHDDSLESWLTGSATHFAELDSRGLVPVTMMG